MYAHSEKYRFNTFGRLRKVNNKGKIILIVALFFDVLYNTNGA